MKNVTVKVITISSQLLVVTLFLTLVFSGGTNNQNITIGNNNFDKMADKTMTLFKSEELLLSSVDTSVVVPLDDDTKKEEIKEEEVKEEATEEPVVDTAPVISDTPTTPSSSGLFYDREVLNTVVGNLTGYGANCYGCSGYTAAGHNLNESMYYDDNEFGTVRILAADPSFPFYSIFRISNVLGMDDFIGIVLDRGGNVGFNRGTLFDLAFINEKDPGIIGLTPNVKFEMLRNGK